MNRGPRFFVAPFGSGFALGNGPAPPPPSDGPQPAHLLLFGAILLGLVLLLVVLIRRWRKARPEDAKPRGEAAGRIPRAGPSAAGRVLRAIPRFLSIVIASVLAVVFVVVAALVLVLFNVGQTFFDPGVYKRALTRQDIYERFPALAAEQFAYQMAYIQKHAGVDVENMSASPELEACLGEALGDEAFAAISGFEREGTEGEFARMRPCFERYGESPVQGEGEGGEGEGGGGPPIAFERLTPEDWGTLLSILLPPELMQAQIEGAVDSVFASLDSNDPSAEITVSLVQLREHLRSGAAVEAFMYVVRAQPPCTAEELAELDAGPLRNLPPCRPPDAKLEAMAEEGGEVLAEVLADMPDETGLRGMFGGEGESAETLPAEGNGPFGQSPRENLRFVRLILRLSPLLPMVLLLLTTVFGVRSWRGLMLWWGIPILLAGLIAGGLASAALPVMDWAIAEFLLENVPPSFAPDVVQVGLDIARDIVRALVTPTQVEAGVLVIVCLGMVVASFYLRPKRVLVSEPAS